jgi:hypothetical protein
MWFNNNEAIEGEVTRTPTKIMEKKRAGMENGPPTSSPYTPRFTYNIAAKGNEESLTA